MLRALRSVLTSLCCGIAAAQSPIAEVVRAFAPFDLDGDGRAEVHTVESIDEVGEAGKPLVVLLVEDRLWAWRKPAAPDAEPVLQAPLRRLASDIGAEGHRVLLLRMRVQAGGLHQDGRTVLALRRLFQRLHAASPMAAVVLVGHFPDAMLVRTCNWRRNEVLELPGKDGNAVAIDAGTTNVRAIPEIVAHRCDVVLADLDGDWERCYLPGPSTLRSSWATFGASVPERGGVCQTLKVGEISVADVFHVRDGAAIADETAFALHFDPNDRDHEVSAAERARGNPMALPDIAVSRIDARGFGWWLGEGAFEPVQHMVPRPRPREAAEGPPAWVVSPAYEVELLRRYLERNHRFRSAPPRRTGHRPASIAHELGSGFAALRAADAACANFAEPGYDVHTGADLLELFRWLQRPAVLRTLRAHSDPWGAAFAATDPDALQRELGLPWHWVKDGERLVPIWRDHRGGRADHVFWRAVAEQEPTGGPFLLLHTGCEALSPPGAHLPFDHPEYGKFGHAEAILFFSECVAMLGRAKVFYDEPREFAEVLGKGGTIGDAWKRYFELESQAANWDEVGGDIGRKRAYFWSIVGDCTLRLPKVAGR